MLSNFGDISLSSISHKKKIYLIGIVFLIGIYLGIILFGENSIFVLFKTNQEKEELTKEIKSLKESNQKLQKEYFLLKQLEPKESNN